ACPPAARSARPAPSPPPTRTSPSSPSARRSGPPSPISTPAAPRCAARSCSCTRTGASGSRPARPSDHRRPDTTERKIIMEAKRIIGAVLGTTLLGAAAVPAAAAPPEDEIEAGDTAFVDVAAATVWVEPETNRGIDRPSMTNPVDLDAWNASMQDTETRQWLTGKLETQGALGSEVEGGK